MIYSSNLLYTPTMSKLDDISAQIRDQKRPPVDQWKPANLGEIDIRIDTKGRWFHEGEPIQRPALVKLFASILWFENNAYYLVTPVEKLKIEVADVPFLVNHCERVDGVWVATDNVQTQTIIGRQNPVELRKFIDQKVPYVKVRYDLWARVNRSVYIDWVNTALDESASFHDVAQTKLVLSSGDYQFEVAE
jgi:hypothetical protein